MDMKQLVDTWFARWEAGDYLHLPVTDDFEHTSPFGTIAGKQAYTDLVKANEEKFLGYRFERHDALYGTDNACVRYTAVQGDFRLDVSEWYYAKDGKIRSIVSYYHIGEVRDERKLS